MTVRPFRLLRTVATMMSGSRGPAPGRLSIRTSPLNAGRSLRRHGIDQFLVPQRTVVERKRTIG
jgi:hypothetical protein